MTTTRIKDQPVTLDKGCYWLICVPVIPNELDWKWKGIIWRKGDDTHLTHKFKPTIAECESWASSFMRCKEDDDN